MKKLAVLTKLHKSHISGASRGDNLEILSPRSAPTAKKSQIFSLCPSMLVIYSTLMIAIIALSANNVSALTYQDNVGLNFTFNPSITVSLSSSDIVINDLTPGSSSDSNIVTVTVLSNNRSGYKLGSTVGSATEDNSNGAIYNTDKLIHASYTSADNTNIATGTFNKPIFTNLTTTTATLADFSDNTWGYSYSLDGGTTWINANKTAGVNDTGYNGLPLYTGTPAEMKTATGPSASGGDSIKFKIAAKASTTQSSGEYNNVVNFIATGETNPKGFYEVFADAGKQMYNGYYKMQDMTSSICSEVYTSALADNSDTMEAQLIDVRDGKVYWVAKLKDGKCWMTQNLDLDLSTGTALTSNDTDLQQYGANGYDSSHGYKCSNQDASCSGGVISWTPGRDTANAITTMTTSIDTFTNPADYNAAVSVDPGDWYWDGSNNYSSSECPSVNTTNPTYIGCDYISKRTTEIGGAAITNNWATYFSTTPYAHNKTHDHVGNYYNWSAAIASDYANGFTASTLDASGSPANSICPAGWRLPVIATNDTGNNEFYNLYTSYGGVPAKWIASPLYSVRSGYVWLQRLRSAGNSGFYWSNTVANSQRVYVTSFTSDVVDTKNYNVRIDGESIRCVAQ